MPEPENPFVAASRVAMAEPGELPADPLDRARWWQVPGWIALLLAIVLADLGSSALRRIRGRRT